MKEHIEILLEDLDAEKCQLFDVREIREWQISRLKQAILQPLSFLKKGLLYQETNREKKTYLHCSFGKRVYPASFLLQAMGFKEIIPLSEGILELKEIFKRKVYFLINSYKI